MTSLPAFLRDIFFPPYARCLLCKDPRLLREETLCDHCQGLLIDCLLSQPLCKRCGHALDEDGCAFCKAGRMEGIFRMTAPYAYQGAAKKLVRHLKYQGFEEAGSLLAHAMLLHYKAQDWAIPHMITFVPMTGTRQRVRGGNHGECLAKHCAAELNLPMECLLKRTRNGKPQASLNRAQRLTNLQGAFTILHPMDGERILLIDDVVTTGATARECAKTLLEAGARQVTVLSACMS